jgi:SNF2 family DNA or RNA helicase
MSNANQAMLKLKREANYTLKKRGFSYQIEAVHALQGLPFAAIFHEQGLGKTKIAIDLALLWLEEQTVDSILIVTKKGLVKNWCDEFATHTHIQPRILSQNRNGNFFAFTSPARIYLTHYEVIINECKRFALFLKTRKVGAILDEAHKIKNPAARITKAIFSLAASFARRLILTGTPVANRPYDIWAPIKFLDHGEALGSDFLRFKADLDLGNDLATNHEKAIRFERALASIYQKIQPFTVRRTKDDAGISLPDKEIANLPVALAPRQRALYDEFKTELRAQILKHGQPIIDNAEEILKRLLRLVQVASNPNLVDDSYAEKPGKFPVLYHFVATAAEAREKIIVWTAFTDNVDWLAKALHEFGAVRVHGKLNHTVREKSLSDFKHSDEHSVLVATPAAAKEGLTLTVANHAVFYDRSFSLDDYLQAQDRIHRISQGKTCYITNLIGENTIDEWIDVLLAAKRRAARLVQGDISQEQYAATADYTFGAMIKEVLGQEDAGA